MFKTLIRKKVKVRSLAAYWIDNKFLFGGIFCKVSGTRYQGQGIGDKVFGTSYWGQGIGDKVWERSTEMRYRGEVQERESEIWQKKVAKIKKRLTRQGN